MPGRFLFLLSNLTAFSISGENSQVVMIAISAAVAIILLAVVTYILIGRWVHSLFYDLLSLLHCLLPSIATKIWKVWSIKYFNNKNVSTCIVDISFFSSLSFDSPSLILSFFFSLNSCPSLQHPPLLLTSLLVFTFFFQLSLLSSNTPQISLTLSHPEHW